MDKWNKVGTLSKLKRETGKDGSEKEREITSERGQERETERRLY